MARQKLGQHFLISDKILERIAAAACGEGVPLAVEIGPGKGVLTRRLLGRAERVVAIELDAELAGALPAETGANPRLRVVQANALDVDWSLWGEGVLAGNLPYYAATAMISKYLRKPGPLKSAVFLIQKEVAQRITAKWGTRDYGYFSVECQFLARTEYLFSVAPGAFRPPPKVESAVIRLIPDPSSPEASVEPFLRFASACFRQKRKTLRNNLAAAFPDRIRDEIPELSRRAEQLSVAELIELYRSLTI